MAPPGTLIGAYRPRHFGYHDRAVSVYSHISDRIGVYGTQVISCAPREATYVLTSILDNDTSIDPQMHTTDTHGFTETLWGLCHLLGIDFMPRLKDLADQRLWRTHNSLVPDALDLVHVWPLQRRHITPHGVYFANRTMPAFILPDPVDA